MIDWIKKEIDPTGIDKKNRFAIFKTIADIMTRVKDDATIAFNAHFPYLADEEKLSEHAKALNIPRLIHDKPEEFRNRVTAASFFLMKAGERGFINELLKERFEDRYQIIEKFLQIQAKIADLTDEEKAWVFNLLDSLINPVVSLEISEWLRFVDLISIKEIDELIYAIKRKDLDTFGERKLRNGTYKRDGSINRKPTGFRDELRLTITRHEGEI